MSKYIRAVVAAKAIADKYGIPLGDLVDTFADILCHYQPSAVWAVELFPLFNRDVKAHCQHLP